MSEKQFKDFISVRDQNRAGAAMYKIADADDAFLKGIKNKCSLTGEEAHYLAKFIQALIAWCNQGRDPKRDFH